MQPYDESLGDYVVTPYTAHGVPGEIISVRTNAGRRVNAWRSAPQADEPAQTWCSCHGFSLETFHMFGYSIISGAELKKVLTDEYRRLGVLAPHAPPPPLKANDLLVWWRGSDAIHSAIVETAMKSLTTSQIDDRATTLTSKSDTGVLKLGVSLAVLMIDFRTAPLIEAYR